MAELEPVEPLVRLLADIDAGHVVTADDCSVILLRPDGTWAATVTEQANEIERRSWAYEPAQDRRWRLRPLGRWVLDRSAP